jgi:hypothetical protein
MIELIVLLLAVLAVIAVYYVLKTAKLLIVNTIMGLIILVVSNIVFKMGIDYSTTSILVCALGGIPGALLVIILHVLNVAF